MQSIGLTGGIGSGKSLVARILKTMGYPVYIADTQAGLLMNHHPAIRKEITACFGSLVYSPEGSLNKVLLAKIIFEDKEALHTINRIVHPRVMADFKEWCRQQKSEFVFFESAILFEASLESHFDWIICVSTSLQTRIRRVRERDRTTTEKVTARIRSQMEEAEKCRRSDWIIHNDEEDRLLEQILKTIETLKRKELKE